MNNLKSYLLATVGIVSFAVSLTLNIVRANNSEASTVAASTAHFNPGRTYLFSLSNGTGKIKCKVTEVDGAWLSCEGSNGWVNTNTMMYVSELPIESFKAR